MEVQFHRNDWSGLPTVGWQIQIRRATNFVHRYLWVVAAVPWKSGMEGTPHAADS